MKHIMLRPLSSRWLDVVLLLGAIAIMLVLSACAGTGQVTGTPEQLRELAKVKDAVAVCVQLNTPWGPQRTSVVSVDKGLSATVSVDEQCKQTITVTQPEKKAP